MKYEIDINFQNISNFHFNENLGFYFFDGEFDIPELGKVNYFAKFKLVTNNWNGAPTKIIRSISFFINGQNEISDNYYQSVYLKVNNELKNIILKIKNDRNKLIEYVLNNDIPSVLHEPIKISENYTILEDLEDIEDELIIYYDEETDESIVLTIITEEEEDSYVDGPEDPQDWFDHPYTYNKVNDDNLAYTKDGKIYIIKDSDAEIINEIWKKKGQEEEENREPPEPDYDDDYYYDRY